MTGSSILPVAIYKGVLHFLFGRDIGDTPGFACFGGGVEDHEKELFKAALREGAEEMKGFLGTPSQLQESIQKNGGHFDLDFKLSRGHYHCHIICIDYDPRLPKYYNQNHVFLMSAMDKSHWKANKHLFEKVEIDWMTTRDMKRRRSEFRPFYRDIVDQLLEKEPEIRKFANSCVRKNRKSRNNNKIKKHIKTRKIHK
jgi:hypothetical protein